MDYQNINPKKLKEWFKRFAKNECKEVSPLYYFLSNEIAKDDELIEIASHCKQRQPMPNLFLASIHYLLLKSPTHELSAYYPSINKNPKIGLPFELFKSFCLNHKQEIIELEQSKIVQTNALNRCAYLMPIISSLFDDIPINIVDIGTSAGLTLNMDKYEYHYNDKCLIGRSPVKIRSKIIGGELPKFKEIIKINNKIGIDQNPLDLKIAENAIWLKALIWADRIERIEKIEQAIRIAKQENIQFEKAKSIADFEELIQCQPSDMPLVIYHTHTLYQFTPQEREAFWNLINRIGKERDLIYLATEHNGILQTDYGLSGVLVEVTQYKKGGKSSKIAAQTNGHADWIKWT